MAARRCRLLISEMLLAGATGACGTPLATVSLIAHLEALAVVASPVGLGHPTIGALLFVRFLVHLNAPRVSGVRGQGSGTMDRGPENVRSLRSRTGDRRCSLPDT